MPTKAPRRVVAGQTPGSGDIHVFFADGSPVADVAMVDLDEGYLIRFAKDDRGFYYLDGYGGAATERLEGEFFLMTSEERAAANKIQNAIMAEFARHKSVNGARNWAAEHKVRLRAVDTKGHEHPMTNLLEAIAAKAVGGTHVWRVVQVDGGSPFVVIQPK